MAEGKQGEAPVDGVGGGPAGSVAGIGDQAVMSEEAVPELVPARMLNELAYCPRLFHLEWVEARFADSADTVEGRWHHRVVDRGGGSAPLVAAPSVSPGGDDGADVGGAGDQPSVVRSLLLSSTSLGIVAKADLVEGAPDGTVVPVDYKRGRPAPVPERAWEPERMQLCAIGLLLREAGYRCGRGVLWFAGSRERVDVEFDDALVERTLALVDEARRVASLGVAPAPLVDSPKCPRCSLVGLCLPDEVNVLNARSQQPPRRLVPSDSDARPVYVTEPGARVGKEQGRLTVTVDRREIAGVRLIDVSQLCVYGNVQVSTQVLRELMAREIPVSYFSSGGWFSGIAHGLPGRNVDVRRMQVVVAAQGSLTIARRVVEGKVRNSRTLLRRNGRQRSERTLASLADLAAKASTAASVPSLLGIEGAAARLYFGSFPTMLKEELRLPGGPFEVSGRSRRPPRDAINCLLSYGYGRLVKDLTAVTFAVGLDPYLGFYHRPRFGRPALALDLAEELRPLIVESMVLTLVNNGEIDEGGFVARGGGIGLTPDGRRAVLRAYERRVSAEVTHPRFGYRISYRRVMEVQARLLAGVLVGDVPDYPAFVTR